MIVLRIEKAGDAGELDGGLSLLFTTSAWNFCGEFYFRLFTVCSTFLRIRPTPRKALTFQRCWNGFFKFTLSLITIKLFIVFIPLVRNRTVSYIEIIFKGLFALQSHLSFLREIARINRRKQFQLRKLCKNRLVLGWYNHYRQFFLDEVGERAQGIFWHIVQLWILRFSYIKYLQNRDLHEIMKLAF